jgi:hypothetical protein
MTDYRVLVTGSRDWDHPDIIRAAMLEVQAAHPCGHMVLVHGMCDPHHPRTRVKVPWQMALRLQPHHREILLGADWLADVIARDLCWETEPHPADWNRGKGAGFARNTAMVKLGASECHAYVGPCVKPGCRDPQPHPSHGGSHCLSVAEKAGIATRRFMAPSLPVTAAPQEETR